MEYLWLSFLAGVLTVLAPCVLPLLPVIIGGSLADKSPIRPLVITLSLAFSIVLFTLLLKVSTAFITIHPDFWKWFSGVIVIFFGFTLLLPHLWEKISVKFNFGGSSQKFLGKSAQHKGLLGMVLIGMALGPVFASCSPTYFLILGTVLPQSFFWGFINLVIYALGLAAVMFFIAVTGQKFMGKLKGAANPHGWFKKSLGVLFLIVGASIIWGLDKKFEAWIIDQGWFGITQLEQNLVDEKQK